MSFQSHDRKDIYYKHLLKQGILSPLISLKLKKKIQFKTG